MTEAERILVAETCGLLRVLQAVLAKDYPQVAELIKDHDTRLWEMIDPAIAHDK